MKIAIPVTDNNHINGHFGKSEKFNIYSIENNSIASVETIPSYQGSGCKSGIASELAERGVKVILTSGIGGGALSKLDKVGIDVIRGCQGSPSENVELFLQGKISDSGSTCEKHHHNDNEHDHHHNHDHNHSHGTSLNGDGLKLR